MKQLVVLSCFIFCLVQVYAVLANDDTMFKCNQSDNSVILSGDLKNVTVIMDNGTYCKPTTVTLENCHLQNRSSIHVQYTEAHNILAGHLPRFEFTCVDKKQIFKPIYKNIQITATSPSYTAKSIPNEQSVALDILRKGSPLGNTAVHIGEQLTLVINGSENHKIKPENCTARAGTNNYTFWSCSNYFDSAIIKQNWTENQHNLSNDLFAFRFIDSTTVDIECYVSVCPQNSMECNTQCSSARKRRRRNSNGLVINHTPSATEAVVSASFNVFSEEVANRSPGLYVDGVLYGIAAVFALCLFK